MKYEAVIGLEVHAQLLTKTKIFCGCSTEFGAPPNTHTCPVCLGMPGVLPVLNRKVVEYTLRMALATNCAVAPESRFARKNYFYPDLPKGYQISQYELPIAEHGHISSGSTARKNRLALPNSYGGGRRETDSRPPPPGQHGRFQPDRGPSHRNCQRTGHAHPGRSRRLSRQLRAILSYLEICDGNMEEGSFRCDANVSIRPAGTEPFGTRAEIKNMNSFKHVENALAYEIERQKECLQDGRDVVQETRLWDPDKGVTVSMRGKEEAHDYRYFPDPDLLPLVIDEAWVEEIRSAPS